MIKPPQLKQGDKIAIVSTARKVFHQEIEPAINFFTNCGYQVVLGKHLYAQYHQFAGTDAERLSDFQEMISRDDIKAIVCARGGYGSVRIIDKIDFTPLISNPKWICGYSDVTVFHSHLHNLGLETLHCTMPLNFPTDGSINDSMKSMIKILQGEKPKYSFTSNNLNRRGVAEGILVGGNLSILYSLIGTKSDINTDGKILFIEDLDEYLYHIDRMIMNLKRSGKLSNLAGIIVGGMSDMNDNTISFGKTAEQIISEAVDEYNYPVCFGFPAGHLDENLALLLGSRVILNVNNNCELNFQ